ncbi:MAG: SAM-dependent methyltransferase, partial [Lachnospiraceae bacterium]|nr:SAM-dependent methyltransferase [Lachnospiraceae bacterium]
MENEKIGNIILDYKHYAGRDLYCDGDVEQEILDAVLSGEEPGLVIEKKANWPFLYHLSPLRENIVNWLPIDKNMKVLEV